MKYKVSNINIPVAEVDISGTPTLTFEELEVMTHDGNVAFVTGSHSWNKLESQSDMSPFFGQWFSMINDDWHLTDCIVLSDKKTIYFRTATQIFR